MRIGGIASGIDTEQMVNELMQAERQPLERVYHRKVQAEWQREGYREVNTMVRRLQEKAFDMRLQGNYAAWKARSSQESVVSAQATGRAGEAVYDVDVKQQADTASWWSSVAGNDLQAGTLRLRTDSEGDYVEIGVDADDEIGDVLAKISGHADLNLQVFHDEDAGVSFTTRNTGEQAVIDFDASHEETKDIMNSIFGSDWNNGEENGVLATGRNAELTVNGLDIERESNEFEIDGVLLTLHRAGEARVTVDADTDAVYERVAGFIEKYNEMALDIQERLNEPLHSDFHPLTDEQKREMSDREIEMWEEKAQSGMLRNDRILSGMLSNLRLAFGSPVEGVEGDKQMLSEIGISTGSWQERGYLHVDEDQLRDAIRTDPDGVMELFTKQPEEEGDQASMGIARRLDSALRTGMQQITQQAGRETSLYDQSFLGNQIRRYEERMDVMEERLQRTEERYWSQFTAMERMVADMNAQANWLDQQLMGMMG